MNGMSMTISSGSLDINPDGKRAEPTVEEIQVRPQHSSAQNAPTGNT